jgi:stearoyl-CoA desaturase (Delta-9 desaturase)
LSDEVTFPFNKDPWWHKALVLLLVVAPLLATVLAIIFLWGRLVTWLDLALFIGGWMILGLGISLGYHRMLTHKAFKARAPVRAVLLAIGSMAWQGPAADWAATHTRHHARADREGDPHSPVEGLFHAHMGWLVSDRFVRSGKVYDQLMADPVTRWVSKMFLPLALLGFIIPAAIGGLVTGTWWGAFTGFLWGGLVRTFIGHHLTWSVNSIAHTFGTRPFTTTDQARNNPFLAPFSFGEGWHNNHHAFPKSAFLGLRWWQVDPGRWIIKILAKLRLIYDVWVPPPEELEKRSRQRST